MTDGRFYRNWIDSSLVNFTVKDKETDLFISAEKDLAEETQKLVNSYRNDITNYIKLKPAFGTSLKPLPLEKTAPAIVKSMLEAGILAGVGPMASVAGAISEFVGEKLLKFTDELIIENGGDIFIKTNKERKLGIYAGNSPLSGKIAIKIKPQTTPLGICTSSGTVGHSLSFGKADAVSVISKNTALADACATRTCNMVKTERDIEKALNFAKSVEGIMAVMVIYKGKMGSIGKIELMRGDTQ